MFKERLFTTIKAKVVVWKYLRRDAVFFFRLRPNCNYFLLPFFYSLCTQEYFFTRLASLYSQGRRWWKNAVLCTVFSHPVTKIFSLFCAFLSFFLKQQKKYQQKIVKCRRQWKVFFLLGFSFIFHSTRIFLSFSPMQFFN